MTPDWFDSLINTPEVKTAIVLAIIGIVGAVSAAIIRVLNKIGANADGAARSTLAANAANYARTVTPGVPSIGPVPLDALPEYTANATEYVATVAPERMSEMKAIDARILARTTVEDAPADVIKAAAADGVLRVMGDQG